MLCIDFLKDQNQSNQQKQDFFKYFVDVFSLKKLIIIFNRFPNLLKQQKQEYELHW